MQEIAHFDAPHIAAAIEALAAQIADRHAQTPTLAIVGIANGGVAFARKLVEALSLRLNRGIQLGVVNIAFHRDDIGQRPIPFQTSPTDLPFSMDDATVILADDVFHTGRTARAAVNELFDQGRPARVELAVLCDRGGRRLPIVPDYTGFPVEAAEAHRVVATLDFHHPERNRVRVLAL